MKRFKFVLFLCLFIYSFPSNASLALASTVEKENTTISWPKGPSVVAESAIVMEASTGLVLYEKNMHDKHYPASITKIMTTLLAMENSSPGDIVTFSKDSVYKVDADSSRLWIDVGEQLTMQQCYYSILLESANDVSYAVAEHVGNGNIDTFIEMMNNRAKEIGALNTHYVNPHGLHNTEHYTTAYDMALITREAMKNPTFRKVFGARTYQIPPTNKQTETRYLRNHHKFVLKETYRYDDCIGGKTGYTSNARYTLVSVAKRGDMELIVVVMRDDSNANQYKDTQKLFDYGFDNFSIYSVSDSKASVSLQESPFFTRYNSLLQNSDIVSLDKKGFVVLPNEAKIEDATKDVVFYSSGEKPDSNILGTVSYTYEGKYVGGANILLNDISYPDLVMEESMPTEETPVAPEEEDASESANMNPVKKDIQEEKRSLKPLILAIILGVLALIVALYYIIVERPRLKRRKAFYKKRAIRKYHSDNDYLDL